MKKRMVWRYWCEFCRKGGCSGGAMVKHEKHCTLNPNRECRMCKRPEPMAGLVEFAKSCTGGELTLGSGGAEKAKANARALSDEAGGCPACILAAIRQSRLGYSDVDENCYVPPAFDFDYKIAKDEWWADHNAERAGEMY